MTDELMRTTDRVLVRNATWLDGSRRDLRIQDGLVEEISATKLSWDDPSSEIEATGHVILPGLVEAHCHLDKTLFGRDWVPHAAEDTLASRISTDRRMRSELGLPDLDAIRALLTRMVATGTSLVRTHTDVDPEVGLEGIRRVREAAQQLERVVRLQQVAFPQHGLLSCQG
jgi:cytosine deaminase